MARKCIKNCATTSVRYSAGYEKIVFLKIDSIEILVPNIVCCHT